MDNLYVLLTGVLNFVDFRTDDGRWYPGKKVVEVSLKEGGT